MLFLEKNIITHPFYLISTNLLVKDIRALFCTTFFSHVTKSASINIIIPQNEIELPSAALQLKFFRRCWPFFFSVNNIEFYTHFLGFLQLFSRQIFIIFMGNVLIFYRHNFDTSQCLIYVHFLSQPHPLASQSPKSCC